MSPVEQSGRGRARGGKLRRAGRLVGAALVAVPLLAIDIPPADALAERVTGPEPVLTITDRRITESSGIAVSARHPRVLWTINDSGDGPHIYGVGEDGKVRARLTLEGVKAYDWEAIAAGPDATLWVGDIGDNRRTREVIRVHVLDEPARLRSANVRARSYRLRYPDGAHDAEALLVHPKAGALMIVSKSGTGGAFYVPEGRLRTDRVNDLIKVADAPPMVTDGAWAPDGSKFALRDYLSATIFAVDGEGRQPGTAMSPGPSVSWQSIERVALPLQPQGESLAWTDDGSALLVGSEGRASSIWRVPLPAKGVGHSSSGPTTTDHSAGASPSSTASSDGSGEATDVRPKDPAGSGGSKVADDTNDAARARGLLDRIAAVGLAVLVSLAGGAALVRTLRRGPMD